MKKEDIYVLIKKFFKNIPCASHSIAHNEVVELNWFFEKNAYFDDDDDAVNK